MPKRAKKLPPVCEIDTFAETFAESCSVKAAAEAAGWTVQDALSWYPAKTVRDRCIAAMGLAVMPYSDLPDGAIRRMLFTILADEGEKSTARVAAARVLLAVPNLSERSTETQVAALLDALRT